MRRKVSSLVPLEVSILDAGLDMRRSGTGSAYGFLLGKEMCDRSGAKLLTAYGTPYKGPRAA